MISPRTWMSQSNLGQSTLGEICLPATHDSGTYGLTDELSYLGVKLVEDIVKDVFRELENKGVPTTLLKAATQDAWAAASEAALGLATTTHGTVGEQLAQGIRALDLRVAYDPSPTSFNFYIHHMLFGPPLSDILSDLQNFLSTTNGEIVYLTMSGWRNFGLVAQDGTAAGTTDSQAIFDQLAQLILQYVQPYVLTPAECDPSLFEMKYESITAGGKSRVILVAGNDADGLTPSFSSTYAGYFFDTLYCPPNENRPKTVIAGRYTATTDVTTALDAQLQQLTENLGGSKLPFALYMTLTPSGTDYVAIVGSAVVDAVYQYARLAGITGAILALLAELLSATVKISYKTIGGWWTLEQLSAQLDTSLDARVADLIYSAVEATGGIEKPTKENPPRTPINFLYIDFFENTDVVSLAMDLTGGHVYTWQGNEALQFQSPSYPFQGAPSAATIDQQIYLGFIANGDGKNYVQISEHFAGSTNSWSGPNVLMSGGTPQASPTGVALASWVTTELPITPDSISTPAVYAVYPVSGGMTMSILTSPDEIGSAGAFSVKTTQGAAMTSKVTPSLAVFRDQLVMAYTNSSSQICFATYDAAGQSWNDYGALQGPSGATSASTKQQPAICAYGDQLVLVYTGGNGNLYWAWTDTIGETWNVNKPIAISKAKSPRRFASNTGTPASAAGPGLAVFRGLLYAIYRGSSYHNLLFATYNGTNWVGNDKISDVASFNPESDATPALAVTDDMLAVFYANESGNAVWGCMLADMAMPQKSTT